MSFLDDLGTKIEDGLESGAEAIGQVVDSGLDAAADKARSVGLSDLGDGLDSAGDIVASWTGGEVDERQLGETDDPKKMIRGESGAITEAATTLTTMAAGLEQTGTALSSIDASGWTGDAADAFRSQYSSQPPLWIAGADAMGSASSALDWWSHTVIAVQARAAEAIDAWARAEQMEAAGRAAAAGGATVTDTWSAAKAEAQAILAAARAERDSVAAQIVSALTAATQSAPEEPPFTTRMWDNLSDLSAVLDHGTESIFRGALDSIGGTVGLVRTLNPNDPYNQLHPQEYQDGLRELGSGLSYAVTHPGETAQVIFDEIKANPFEAVGSAIPDALVTLATGGAGGAASVTRHAVDIAEDVADAGSQVRHLDSLPDIPSTHPTSMPGAPAPHVPDAPSMTDRSGADSGLHDTAADLGPSQDRTPEHTTSGLDPVDLANGEFLLPQTDIALPGVLPLVLQRRHRSGYTSGRWFGPSWSATLDMRVVVESAGVTFVGDDGVLLVYPHSAARESVLPASGPRWPLERTDVGGYRVTDPSNGMAWHFAPETVLGQADITLGNFAISAITDRHLNRIRFRYSADGTPETIEHSGGYHVDVQSAGGRITGLSLDDNVIRQFEYTAGELTAVTNGVGATTQFGYQQGRMTTWTDSHGDSLINDYDERGRVIRQRGQGGMLDATLEYVEAAVGSVTTTTDSLGARTVYGFDSDLRLRDVIDPTGRRTHTDYNERRDPLSVTTPDGATTRHLYTGDGDVAVIERPDGKRTTVDYAAPGCASRITQPDGAMWVQEWAGLELAARVDPDGGATRYGHSSSGAVTSVTNAIGAVRTVQVDGAGLPVGVTDPNGATTLIERDAFGRVIATTTPEGARTVLGWNGEGQLTERRHADGSVEKWTYDGESNLLSFTDAVGATTRYTYGSYDLLAARTDPDGSVTRYDWDTERRLRSVHNPIGDTWQYSYDAAGRLLRETDFNGVTTTYEHDRAGRVVRVATPTGGLRHQFDSLGQLVRTVGDDSSERSYLRDVMGRVVEARSDSHLLEFGYSPAGRMRSQCVDGIDEMMWTYDAAGRRVSREMGDGRTEWAWDLADRIASVTVDNHPVAFAHAGSVESGWTVGEVTVRREVTDRGLLESQQVEAFARPALSLSIGGGSRPDPRVLREDRYSYRQDGVLTGRDGREGARAYEVDAMGRVTGVGDERYEYDALGNVTTDADYEGGRLMRRGRRRFRYDASGRLVGCRVIRTSKPAAQWSYRYDDFGQLVEVGTPDGSTWKYGYDALGRRTSKTHDGETVRFLWDGQNLVGQDSAAGAVRWEYRPGTFTPLTQHEVDKRFYAIVTDLVGSPTDLVDIESGEVVGSSTSTLWGETSWQGQATPLRFPGQYHDDETGLHYNFFRFYDPASGRYTTPDPLGLGAAPNPVTYVSNPTGWTDPLGLMPDACRPDDASSAAQGERLRGQLTAEQIANGHSFDKHVLQKDEFPGVENKEQFAQVIENVITNGEQKILSNDRVGYWLDGVVVVHNPAALDGGTAFVADIGYRYFDVVLN